MEDKVGKNSLTVNQVKQCITQKRPEPFPKNFGFISSLTLSFVVAVIITTVSVLWRVDNGQTYAAWQTLNGKACPYEDASRVFLVRVGCYEGYKIRTKVQSYESTSDPELKTARKKGLEEAIAHSNLDVGTFVSDEDFNLVVGVVEGTMPIPQEWQVKQYMIPSAWVYFKQLPITALLLFGFGIFIGWARRKHLTATFEKQKKSIRSRLADDLRGRFDQVVEGLERLRVLKESKSEDEKEVIALLDKQANMLIERLSEVVVLQAERENINRQHEMVTLEQDFRGLQAELDGSIGVSHQINNDLSEQVRESQTLLHGISSSEENNATIVGESDPVTA